MTEITDQQVEAALVAYSLPHPSPEIAMRAALQAGLDVLMVPGEEQSYRDEIVAGAVGVATMVTNGEVPLTQPDPV